MRISPALLVCGALTLGACASTSDVESTSLSDVSETLPPVDDPDTTVNTSSPQTTSEPPTTEPGTRPVDFDSKVLLASDLPGWEVVAPMAVPAEPTWEALDCPDMSLAWSATGYAGTRSRGTNGDASFRNTAVELATAQEASDVLDAVDRVWTDCTLFDSTSGSFWSEPIEMPSSTLRTSGLVIGNDDLPNWTLAYWQDGTSVVILEVEGDEMWTYLNPLLVTMSARLDGTPTPMVDTRASTGATTTADPAEPIESIPVIVPATPPSNEVPPSTTIWNTTPRTTAPHDNTFPPQDADWVKHPLAHLAPTPSELGPGWEYQYGSVNEAEPADPADAIGGCDAPVPPTLDGFELDYRNTVAEAEAEVSILVSEGAIDDAQTWIDAIRALAACDLDESDVTGTFDITDGTADGVDDSVIIAGRVEFGDDTKYLQALGAARIDGLVVAAFVALEYADDHSLDAAIVQTGDLLNLMLAKR